MDGELVAKFFGRDPIQGEDARLALVREGPAVIQKVVPMDGGHGSSSVQVERRLVLLGRDLGPTIAPHLTDVIARAPWSSKTSATPCFAGLTDRATVSTPLIDVLKKGGDFGAERMAIEAVGYLGASDWAQTLIRYSKRGVWREPSSFEDESVSSYPFEKLSPYVLEALTRFVCGSGPGDISYLFRNLTEYVLLQDEQMPNRGLSGTQLVARHAGEFPAESVDLLVKEWLHGSNSKLQILAAEILGAIAPVRVAAELLAVATSPQASPQLRTTASIALGEIRDPRAARQLADAIRKPGTELDHLDWAFSALSAVPVDWKGTESFAERVLSGAEEPSAQLHYSYALRGVREHRTALERYLDAGSTFRRWSSALALARMLGTEGRALFEHRAEEASDDLERCVMHAAAIRCGDHAKAPALNAALAKCTSLPLLRQVWKAEIIDAFRHARGFDSRAGELWSAAANMGTRHARYFDDLVTTQKPEPPTPDVVDPSKSAAPSPRLRLFVSYSRTDRHWLEKFQETLTPLVRSERVELWDDTRIVPGKWRSQIESALSNTDAALFLVSARFLASEFIMKHELPDLLKMAESKGVKILWVLLEDCLWDESELAEYQGENEEHPLLSETPGEQSRLIAQTCRRIRDLLPG